IARQVNLNPTPLDDDKANDACLDGGEPTDIKTAIIPLPKPVSLVDLPTEIIHEIAKKLHPVDRVCLALTCKRLALAIVSAPRLSPATWSLFSDQRFGWLPPESFSLILRLAHGWIPKDKLRYCWKCHKIMPREEAFFRRRLTYKKNPKWSVKVNLPKHEWDQMRKKDRYKHLVQTWCTSPAEDSSCLYCDVCRNMHLEASNAQLPHPVECPTCLERELTYVWRPKRKQLLRRCMCDLVSLCCGPIKWVIERIAIYLLSGCSAVVRMVYNQGCRCWRAI
ncbi:hypothetical protein A1O3_07596, partial [Capronia epimyces CBS 606.96]